MREGQSYDLIVIGGGPGGYVAAIRAAQRGLKAALVEKQHLGGVCLNWGCIPTKALLRSAEIYHLMHRLESFGLYAQNVRFDLEKMVTRSRNISAQLVKGVQYLLKKNKVAVITGTAKFLGKSGACHQVKIMSRGQEDQIVGAPHVIVATGARPRIPPGLEPDLDRIWTYREAMVPASLPKSLLVIGSGAIGIEFASFYKMLGVHVVVVEKQPHILPFEDEEISALAKQLFEKQGIVFYTKTTVSQLEKEKETLRATLVGPNETKVLEVDRVIVAVGIIGNTENLGLEKTKVSVENGQIMTNAFCETHEPGLYAIGDVAGAPWLAHKASHEAVLCVEGIAGGRPAPLERSDIPGCIYSYPQIASVGLTEKKAKAEGREMRVGRFPFIGNGKAMALGEPEGLIKTIFDQKTGELLGAHMIGAEVTELIHGYGIAKTLEATEEDLIHTIFPHPTLSEMMHESVLEAYGRVIHL